jgi:hypothetical protein
MANMSLRVAACSDELVAATANRVIAVKTCEVCPMLLIVRDKPMAFENSGLTDFSF